MTPVVCYRLFIFNFNSQYRRSVLLMEPDPLFIEVFFKKFGQAAISYSANWTLTQEYLITYLLISLGNTPIYFPFYSLIRVVLHLYTQCENCEYTSDFIYHCFFFLPRLWGFMYFIEGGTGVKVAVLDICHLRSELPPHKVVVFEPDTYLF